jgi:beta-lactamase class D
VTGHLSRGATLAAGVMALAACAHRAPARSAVAVKGTRSCFLLIELGVANPAAVASPACAERVSPASTFKIAHALAALDAGVARGPDEPYDHDGRSQPFASWRRDHTLGSAMHHSVLWVFQGIARQLGPDRERAYLRRLEYGNGDSSSGLTTFWNGGSLKISAEEQLRFLRRLFEGTLPVARSAQAMVRQMLIQPRDHVINAAGVHPFAAPWPADTEVAAKTGRCRQDDGTEVRWLVGGVRRGQRRWVFVSDVIGGDPPPLAAVDLAARSLKAAGVL